MTILSIAPDKIIFSDGHKITFEYGNALLEELEDFVFLYDFIDVRIHKDDGGFYFGDYLWSFFIPCRENTFVELSKSSKILKKFKILSLL